MPFGERRCRRGAGELRIERQQHDLVGLPSLDLGGGGGGARLPVAHGDKNAITVTEGRSERSGLGKAMIAGSWNRLKRNGLTAARESGPPRLNSTTAVRVMLPHAPAVPAARHGQAASPAGCHDRG